MFTSHTNTSALNYLRINLLLGGAFLLATSCHSESLGLDGVEEQLGYYWEGENEENSRDKPGKFFLLLPSKDSNSEQLSVNLKQSPVQDLNSKQPPVQHSIGSSIPTISWLGYFGMSAFLQGMRKVVSTGTSFVGDFFGRSDDSEYTESDIQVVPCPNFLLPAGTSEETRSEAQSEKSKIEERIKEGKWYKEMKEQSVLERSSASRGYTRERMKKILQRKLNEGKATYDDIIPELVNELLGDERIPEASKEKWRSLYGSWLSIPRDGRLRELK